MDVVEVGWGDVDWECSTNGEKRNAHMLLVGKPERRKPLGRQRRRWVDNIRMDIVEVGWGDVDWACSTNGEKRNAYRLLVGKPEGKDSTRKTKTQVGE
jgi:hypothetical protein